MMFDISVVHNQYLIIAILSGIEVTILIILGYIAVWIPRIVKKGHYMGYNGGFRTVITYHPWFLFLTYIGILFFSVWFFVHFCINPPNW